MRNKPYVRPRVTSFNIDFYAHEIPDVDKDESKYELFMSYLEEAVYDGISAARNRMLEYYPNSDVTFNLEERY